MLLQLDDGTWVNVSAIVSIRASVEDHMLFIVTIGSGLIAIDVPSGRAADDYRDDVASEVADLLYKVS